MLTTVVAFFTAFLTALTGSLLTTGGLPWYQTIIIPAWTPPGYVISIAWTIIFILCAISASTIWYAYGKKQEKKEERCRNIIGLLFICNAALNIGWTYIFFVRHQIGFALVEMKILNLTTIILAVLMWRRSRAAALLLVPYIAWVSFATYLTYVIWTLN